MQHACMVFVEQMASAANTAILAGQALTAKMWQRASLGSPVAHMVDARNQGFDVSVTQAGMETTVTDQCVLFHASLVCVVPIPKNASAINITQAQRLDVTGTVQERADKVWEESMN